MLWTMTHAFILSSGNDIDLCTVWCQHHVWWWMCSARRAPSHYSNQCWNIVNWTLGTNFSEIFIGVQTFSFKEMHLKNVCAMFSILSQPQCVNLSERKEPGFQWVRYWWLSKFAPRKDGSTSIWHTNVICVAHNYLSLNNYARIYGGSASARNGNGLGYYMIILIPGPCLEWDKKECRQTSSLSRTKSRGLNVSRILLQLSLPKPLKSRMKMQLEQHRQAIRQLQLSDQQFQYLLRCYLYYRIDGTIKTL